MWRSKSKLSTMLMHAAHSKGIKITHTYLQPGHTHMEAYSIHGIIEKHKKSTIAVIEIPRDWITTIQSIHRRTQTLLAWNEQISKPPSIFLQTAF